MKGKLLPMLCILLMLAGCKIEEDLCAANLCAAPAAMLRLKFASATSNEDLLFSSNPKYQKTDVKIRSSNGTENLPFAVDSTSSAGKTLILWVSSSQTLSVKIGTLAEDMISVETKYISTGCCGNIEVPSIRLNQNLICQDCSSIPVVTIAK